jgi:integrase
MLVMKHDEKLPKSTKIHAKRCNSVAIDDRSCGIADVPRTIRLNFTKKKIEALPTPTTQKHVYYRDFGGALSVHGLTVRVSFTGNKTFVLSRRMSGRPERVVLGPFPDMTVEQARGRASELNSQIAMGENPADTKRQIRDEMTLKELFAQWGELHGKGKRTWLEMEREFRIYLHKWHFKRISSIKKLDVLALQNSLKESRGLYSANHAVRLLRSLYNWAIKSGGWQGQNPASIPLFPEEKRQRFLLPQEAVEFFSAVDAEPNETIRDFIYVSLLTAARRSNIEAMSWQEIDFHQQIWNIPSSAAKAGEPLTIPLLPPVIEILERRKKAASNQWVFPSSGRTGHLIEPKTAWNRIVKRAGLSDLRLHDLRRTLASWQALGGSSLLVIGASLGHRSTASTSIYARLNDDVVRQSMGKAATSLLLAGKQDDKL